MKYALFGVRHSNDGFKCGHDGLVLRCRLFHLFIQANRVKKNDACDEYTSRPRTTTISLAVAMICFQGPVHGSGRRQRPTMATVIHKITNRSTNYTATRTHQQHRHLCTHPQQTQAHKDTTDTHTSHTPRPTPKHKHAHTYTYIHTRT